MKKDDEWKTAFKTEFGLSKYTMMSFELKNASITFQAIISKILQNYLKNFVITYLNDITVYLNILKNINHMSDKFLRSYKKQN